MTGVDGFDDTLAMGATHAAAVKAAGSEVLVRGTILGRYMVLDKIGEGAMGVVYAAYDPELDRRVAIKLLLPDTSMQGPFMNRARLLREAQALAKLSHPNVVAVHDVGTHGQGVWVAMELVVGETLGAWARERERTWPELLRVVTDAARGVAAAHKAGLVHRDLKPENVMVGADGRVRVMDFGMAHSRTRAAVSPDLMATADADSQARPEFAALALRLTQLGVVQGTPAYMAPEQWLGQEAERATDQFGWSVMAWELFYGERPFAGETPMALAANVVAGRRRAPPRGLRVPGGLRHVLERGLAGSAEERWPDMDALLLGLGRSMRRSRIWRAGTIVAGLAMIAFGLVYRLAPRQSALIDSCLRSSSQFSELLNEDRRDAIRRAFLATGVPYADDASGAALSLLNDYAGEWSAGRTDACEANVVGAQSIHLLDLRNACLDRRKTRAGELIELLVHADAAVVEHAAQAVADLPEVASCGDVERLLAAVPPPDDPATAELVEEQRRQLARATALEAMGHYEEGLEVAAAVRERAGALQYAPLDAEAALVEGSLLMFGSRQEAAEVALAQAMSIGLTQDLHSVAAEAAAKRLFVLSNGLGRQSEALVTRPFAEALVERAGGDGRLSALLQNNLGAAYELHGDRPTALACCERARQILEASTTSNPLLVVIHNNLGGMYFAAEQPDRAREHYARAYDLSQELLGEGHPLGAHPLAGLGDVDARDAKPLPALQNYSTALKTMEASYGPDHLYLIHPLAGLGRVHRLLGHDEDARNYFERVVAIADRFAASDPLPADSYSMLAESLEGLAELAVNAGDLPRAQALSERARDIFLSAKMDEQAQRALGPGSAEDRPVPFAFFDHARLQVRP